MNNKIDPFPVEADPFPVEETQSTIDPFPQEPTSIEQPSTFQKVVGRIDENPVGHAALTAARYMDVLTRIPLAQMSWMQDRAIAYTKGEKPPDVSYHDMIDDAVHLKGTTPYTDPMPSDILNQNFTRRTMPEINKARKEAERNRYFGTTLKFSRFVESAVVGGVTDLALFGGSLRVAKLLSGGKSRVLTDADSWTKAGLNIISNQKNAKIIKDGQDLYKGIADQHKVVIDIKNKLTDLDKRVTSTPSMIDVDVPYTQAVVRNGQLVQETATRTVTKMNPVRVALRKERDAIKAEYIKTVPEFVDKARPYLESLEYPLELRLKLANDARLTKKYGDGSIDEAKRIADEINMELKAIRKVRKSPEVMMNDLWMADPTARRVGKTGVHQTAYQKANELYKVLEDSIPMLDNIDTDLKNLVEKYIIIDDIDGLLRKPLARVRQETVEAMAKDTARAIPDYDLELEIAGAMAREKSLSKVSKKYVDKFAESISRGEIPNYKDLPLDDIRSLHGEIKNALTLPKYLTQLGYIFNWMTPQRLVLRRMGMGHIVDPMAHANAFWVNQPFQEAYKALKVTAPKEFKKMSGKDWDNDAQHLYWHYADKGADAEDLIPTNLKTKFSDPEKQFISKVAEDFRVRKDALADEAVRRKMMTEDPIEADMTGLPLRLKNWIHHSRDRLINNLDATQWGGIDGEDLSDIFKSTFEIAQKKKPKIPKGYDISEFKNRKLNDDLFIKDNATEIDLASHKAELKAVYLRPLVEKADAYTKLIPDPVLREQINRHLYRYVTSLRGMVMKGDENLNRWNAEASKLLSKEVSKLSGGRLHWETKERAWEETASMLNRRATAGTMWANTVSTTKQFLQVMQTVPELGVKSTLDGFKSVFDPYARDIMHNYVTMFGRGMAIEHLDISNIKSLYESAIRLGYEPNAFIDKYLNCVTAGNGAIKYVWNRKVEGEPFRVALAEYCIKNRIPNVASKDQSFWRVLNQAYKDPNYSSRFQPLMDYADLSIEKSQYSYARSDMPIYTQSATGRLVTQFTSWFANYTTNYLPSLVNTLRTGKDIFGFPISKLQRMRVFHHLSLTGMVIALGMKMGYDMWWDMPVGQIPAGRIAGQSIFLPVPPPLQTGIDLGMSAWKQIAEPIKQQNPDLNLIYQIGKATFTAMEFNEIEMDEPTKRLITDDLPMMMIPGWIQAKRVNRVVKGEADWKSLILPVSQKKNGSPYR
jgi:hypothetical protein